MSADTIKEIYDILCYHLGEKDNRGNIRLPDKYNALKSDLGKFVGNVCRTSRAAGMQAIAEDVKRFSSELARSTSATGFKLMREKTFISRAGQAAEGYALRHPPEEEQDVTEDSQSEKPSR